MRPVTRSGFKGTEIMGAYMLGSTDRVTFKFKLDFRDTSNVYYIIQPPVKQALQAPLLVSRRNTHYMEPFSCHLFVHLVLSCCSPKYPWPSHVTMVDFFLHRVRLMVIATIALDPEAVILWAAAAMKQWIAVYK